MVAGKAEMPVSANLTLRRLELAYEELKQRRLASTVGANKRQTRVQIQTKVQIL